MMSDPQNVGLLVRHLRRMALGDGAGENLRSDERQLLNAAADEIEQLRHNIKEWTAADMRRRLIQTN